MSKKSSLKVFGSGGATSHAGVYGYSGYKATEDEWRRPNVAQVYSAEVEEEVKPEGNPLDPYYQNQRDLLEKQKTDDLAALDRNRVQQRQEAAINNELLMKYLPQLNKANGLAGLGVSETANIDALSRYQTNLGKIEATHQQGLSDIERAYRSDLAKIDDAERAEIIGDQRDAFGLAWEYIASGGATDRETLDRYLDGIEDTVSESQLAQLKALGDSIVSETEKQTESTKTSVGTNVGQYVVPDVNGNAEMEASTNLDTVGSVVKVQGGGQIYALESSGIADDSAWQAANENNVTDGSVFLYDDGIYLKQNGRVYALSGTGGNYNTADYTSMYKYLSGAAPTIQQNTQNAPSVPSTQNPTQSVPPTQNTTQENNSNGVDMNKFTPANTSDTTLISNFNRLNPKDGEVVTVMDMYTNEVQVMKKDGVLYQLDNRPIVELSARGGTVKGKLEPLNRWWHVEAYNAAKDAGEGNVAYVKENVNSDVEYFTIKDGKLYKVEVTERNTGNAGDLVNHFKDGNAGNLANYFKGD